MKFASYLKSIELAFVIISLISLISFSSIYAQNKYNKQNRVSKNSKASSSKHYEIKARKFDEFTIGFGDPNYHENFNIQERQDKEIKERVIHYAKQLKQENAKPYIITYSPQMIEWESFGRSIASTRGQAFWLLLTPLGFNYKEIIAVDGGFREVATTELWIVPPGAEIPSPSPTIKDEYSYVCPFVQILGFRYFPKANKSIEFEARVTDNDISKRKRIFNWKVSRGKIISGDGTSKISVSLPINFSGDLLVKVEVEGYSLECPIDSTNAIYKTKVGEKRFKLHELDKINCSYEYELRVLDDLSAVLKAKPDLQTHIVIYAGRISYINEVKTHLERMKNYLIEMGVEPDRIITINGGYRNQLSGELWISEKGVQAPETKSTVDEAYVITKKLSKGKDFSCD